MTNLHVPKRFQSSDLDEIRESMTRVFTSHNLSPLNNNNRLGLDAWEHKFGESALVYVNYGAPVLIEADALESSYIFQVAANGEWKVSTSAYSGDCNASKLSVISSVDPFSLRWSRYGSALTVRLSRKAVEQNLMMLLGREPHEPVVFSPFIHMGTSEGRSWSNLVNFIRGQLSLNLGNVKDVGVDIENMVAKFALQLFEHNFTDELMGTLWKGDPKIIQRAKEYVNDHLDTKVEVTDLVRVCGTSHATLGKYFKEYLEVSPARYIRNTKLDAAQRKLMRSGLDTRVGDIAAEYGFDHFGRFCHYYKERFGEAPSSTLRRTGKS